MADSPLFLSDHGQAPSGGGSNVSVSPNQSKIGDLRRRYNFGASVSELAIDQTPFFRFVSQVANNPTDDPEFKSTEERSQWHKRYAYLVAMDLSATAIGSGDNDNEYTDFAFAAGDLATDSVFAAKFQGDYNGAGNVQSILGQTAIAVGASGTKPQHFLVGQLIKIPVSIIATASLGTDEDEKSVDGSATGVSPASADYLIAKVTSIADPATGADANSIYAMMKVVRPATAVASSYYVMPGANYEHTGTTFDGITTTNLKEEHKCYAVGSAHAEGSSFPASYKDTPYMVRTGYTQIWKTTCQMTNTARATQLKLVPDEWARIWKNKLIEHKYDIEQSLLFGRGLKDGTTSYTQGIVDFCLQEGNIFSWTTAKSQDDFLEDMSDYLDPRYNNANATLFMCSTEVYNWLHKIGGYLSQNVGKVNDGTTAMGRYDMAIAGKSKKFGLDITTISTPYGDMNVTRNIHLDSGQGGASIVAVNMKHVKYRPLAGNGLNRDTSIYVGVQSLENTGMDRRIDLIQTEAGLQCNMPEAHAVWK